MDKIKAAVIGIGAMGKSHARIYSDMDSAELVAVCDKDEKAAKETARKYNARPYADYRKIDESIDAVSVCVPTKLHKDVALFFINKGINVIVEKPVASSINEAKELINAAKNNNVKLMVGHVERFNPVIGEIKKRIDNDELGKIYSISSLRFSPFPHRVIDVGVAIDLAVHDIDIIAFLNKAKIKRIYAETGQRIHASHEDILNALIKFENDVTGIISTNWLTPKKVRELYITGENGMFVANYLTQDLYFYKNKLAEKDFDYSKGVASVVEGDMIKIKIDNKEPLLAELEEFAGCILEDRKPMVSGEDGLKALEIATKMVEAAKTNKVVSL
ncbi:Gfo/Idh/MocA family oxidoreductase [Candidatus Woesearchaeota archaeon]|nr:Gfo/Idh/MocA family oxidoreductase [Candidatus Woesearchaeota archaeon]